MTTADLHPALVAAGIPDRCDIVPVSKDSDEKAWLKLRKGGIGSSDAGPILGLSPYAAPVEVWAEKLGFLPPPDLSDNDAVWLGNTLEEPIAQRTAERYGFEVIDPDATLILRSAPVLRTNIDRFFIDDDGLGILEIKFADSRMADDWNPAPPWYQAQLAQQAAVSGVHRTKFAVVLGGQLQIVDMNFTPEFIERLADQLLSWWNRYIVTGEQPPTDGSKSATEVLQKLWNVTDTELEVGPETLQHVLDYRAADRALKEAEEAKALAGNRLRQALGPHTTATFKGTQIFTHKESDTSRLDVSRHELTAPDCHARHLATTTTRTLNIKRDKAAKAFFADLEKP